MGRKPNGRRQIAPRYLLVINHNPKVINIKCQLHDSFLFFFGPKSFEGRYEVVRERLQHVGKLGPRQTK